MYNFSMPPLKQDTSSEPPKRDEAKVAESKKSLEIAVAYLEKDNAQPAEAHITKSLDDFFEAYKAADHVPALSDGLRFLDAIKTVLTKAQDEQYRQKTLEQVMRQVSKKYLGSAEFLMTKKEGALAATPTGHAWIMLSNAFPSGVPADQFGAFCDEVVRIVQDTAPHMKPVIDNVMQLRSGYTIDPKRPRVAQVEKAREMTVALVQKVLQIAFYEKLNPGERVETRAIAAGAGLNRVDAWEREFKGVQTPEWQKQYDLVLKQIDDIAMGK
jgi:hypothetical protein